MKRFFITYLQAHYMCAKRFSLQRICMLSLFCIMGSVSYAQQEELSNFTLLEDGSFVTLDSHESSKVFYFEGKTAEELYNNIRTNARQIAKTGEQVDEVENRIVTLYVDGHLLTDVVLGLPLSCSGRQFFEFLVKDGRVKVNAPTVENHCHYGTSDNICYFTSVLKSYFKNGVLKEKKRKEYDSLVSDTNYIINSVLGLVKKESSDDW